MATITTVSHGNYLNSARRQYITLSPYHQDIFQYTTSVNPQTFVTTGALTALSVVGTATVSNCPANRILRENGKKLYPSGLINANDTSVTVGPYPGVTTYMVGVYDVQNGLSGYIDPNSQVFALYNGDKPNYVPRGINPNGGAVDQGSGVYSLGLGQFGANLNVGTFISTGGAITAGTTVFAGTSIGYGGPGYTGIQTVTQQTNKSTGVSVNGPVVDITMNGAALASDAAVTFTLTDTSITASDTLVCIHKSGGTVGRYTINANVTAASTADITVCNVSAGSLSEAIVIRVYVLQS